MCDIVLVVEPIIHPDQIIDNDGTFNEDAIQKMDSRTKVQMWRSLRHGLIIGLYELS